MISIILTMALLLFILEQHMPKESDSIEQNVLYMDLVTEAKLRYLIAYEKTDQDMTGTFDSIIRRSSFVNGYFAFHDAYTFKQVLVDAVTKFPKHERAEVMFVMDFMMEAYHEVIAHHKPCQINMTMLREFV